MSVRLLRSDLGFCFAFRCDAGCERPEIVALVPIEGGGLLHRCPSCRFDLIVEPLIRDLGWRRAA
jgi:hypothetical protein